MTSCRIAGEMAVFASTQSHHRHHDREANRVVAVVVEVVVVPARLKRVREPDRRHVTWAPHTKDSPLLPAALLPAAPRTRRPLPPEVLLTNHHRLLPHSRQTILSDSVSPPLPTTHSVEWCRSCSLLEGSVKQQNQWSLMRFQESAGERTCSISLTSIVGSQNSISVAGKKVARVVSRIWNNEKVYLNETVTFPWKIWVYDGCRRDDCCVLSPYISTFHSCTPPPVNKITHSKSLTVPCKRYMVVC